MPRVKTIVPEKPSREKGQRSLDDMYINRIVPSWAHPYWEQADFWREVVRRLPVAIACRETLVSYMTSLEWKIEPRESSERDELKETIKSHTKLFESGGGYEKSGWDFIKLLEFVLQDCLDTPFGSGVETIRDGDKPDGDVLYILPIDSATLFPTRDKEWPVAQRIKSNPTKTVVFPSHAINRMYFSPHNKLQLEGWGMPPPEKAFLAIEMIRRGDYYYWKFLSDTPESGVLDLMDFDEESATEWIKSFKTLFAGIEPFKIPVLYGHTEAARWIPFGKDPNAIQFDSTYSKYVTLVCSLYGLSPSDIGFPSVGGGGGQTLAGSIRDERRTKRSGIARLKKITGYWFNRMLPKSLKFVWIDLDDEVSVALGRARLANATAASQYIENRIFTPKEMRLQAIADGLMTISMPEDVPEDEFDLVESLNAQERPGMLGAPVNPSQGGQGEVLNRSGFDELLLGLIDLSDMQIRKLAKSMLPGVTKEFNTVLDELDYDEVTRWLRWHDDVLWGNLKEEIPEITLSTIDFSERLVGRISKNENWLSFEPQDLTPIVNKFMLEFRDIRESDIVNKSVLDYESCKSSTYIDEVEPDKELEKKFKSDIRKATRQFLLDLDISKAVLRGLRNTIIMVGLLDNQEEINDNTYVLSNIRQSLANFYYMKLSEFQTILEEKIEQYLEEDLNVELQSVNS
ncbi:MAG: hypothetical protein ACXAAP_12575 [Candidatus Thorarchaeota archaeon]|jgi:hypothetical protein